jgi:hypothetical protein
MCAVPSTAVFCSSLIVVFLPATLLDTSLFDFEIVPVGPNICGITFVFKFYYYAVIYHTPNPLILKGKHGTVQIYFYLRGGEKCRHLHHA